MLDFTFDVPPPITMQYILDQVGEEAIFSRYLGIIPRLGDTYCNTLPGRPKLDRNPGCSFFERSDGKLIFNDWGWRKFDCFDVAAAYYGQSADTGLKTVLEQIAGDFNLAARTTPASLTPTVLPEGVVRGQSQREGYTPIQIALKPWIDRDRQFWQLPDRSVSDADLTRGEVYNISAYWMGGRLSMENLSRSYAYRLGMPDKFQVYRPFTTNRHFRFRQSSSSWVVGLSQVTPGRYVLVTKSNKDRFLLNTLLGYPCVNTLTEGLRFSADQMTQIEAMGKPILLGDNDEAGLAYVKTQSEETGWDYLVYPDGWPKDSWDVAQKWSTSFLTDYLDEQLGYLGL